MSCAKRQPVEQPARYSIAELVEMRRQILRYARSLPSGADRNEHRQVAVSLGRLFKNPQWRSAHTVEGSR
jgi:hypothetical protein